MSNNNVTHFPDKNRPAPEFVQIDEKGRKMFFFATTYSFENADWSVEFWAYSKEDANRRIQTMRDNLGAKGCFQILEKIDG